MTRVPDQQQPLRRPQVANMTRVPDQQQPLRSPPERRAKFFPSKLSSQAPGERSTGITLDPIPCGPGLGWCAELASVAPALGLQGIGQARCDGNTHPARRGWWKGQEQRFSEEQELCPSALQRSGALVATFVLWCARSPASHPHAWRAVQPLGGQTDVSISLCWVGCAQHGEELQIRIKAHCPFQLLSQVQR